jgi:hypothetical protein
MQEARGGFLHYARHLTGGIDAPLKGRNGWEADEPPSALDEHAITEHDGCDHLTSIIGHDDAVVQMKLATPNLFCGQLPRLPLGARHGSFAVDTFDALFIHRVKVVMKMEVEPWHDLPLPA